MYTIKELCTSIHLPYIKNNYEELIKEAINSDLSFEDFLQELLQGEAESRFSNGVSKKIASASFPYKMTIKDFKLDHFSVELKTKIKQLETLDFIKEKENIILVGNPGTGKSALSIVLGMEACLKNKSVLFISVPTLMIEINEAMSRNQILSYKKKFEKYDLCILDELGYCSFSKEAGEVLFNLLSSRNEVGSIIITSNLTLDKWNDVFKDQILTGAIVDRLACKSHLIDMSGESYRIKETKEWLNGDEKKI